MQKSKCFVALAAATALTGGWSPAAAAPLGARTLQAVQKLGTRSGLTRDRAEKRLKGRMLSFTDVQRSTSGVVSKSRLKEAIIRAQIRLLKSNLAIELPSSRRYPDYLFRLAELYHALRLNRWTAAMALDERIYRAGDTPRAARLRQLQQALFAASRTWLKRALQQYVQITSNRRYSRYSRMDEVVFSVGDIAKTLAEQAARSKDPAQQTAYQRIMLEQFSRLLKHHPRSRFVPDALLAKGEYFFHGRQMVEAIQVYQKVARYQTRLGAYADYKIGWCYLNLKKHRLALAKFVGVAQGTRGGQNLVQAARNDVVRAYSHIGVPEKAHGFFRTVVKGRASLAREMYLRLGTLYYAQGKNRESIRVFSDALAQWPRDPDRCDWMTTIVDAQINLGDKAQQVAVVRRLGQVTRALTLQLGDKAARSRRCRSATENTIKTLATQWHKEGLTTGNIQTLHRTRRLYQAYLETYPRSPLVYLMTYQYADLLWVLATKQQQTSSTEWAGLARLFTRIVKMPRPKQLPEKEYVRRRNDAALASVRCWMSSLHLDKPKIGQLQHRLRARRPCSRRRGRRCVKWGEPTYPEQVIPADEQALLRAFGTYIRHVRGGPHLALILFNSCHVYWKHNQFERALPLCLKLARSQQRAHPVAARVAAHRVIGMLIVRKRLRAAEALVDRFRADNVLSADAVFLATMNDFKLKVMWARADRLRREKKFAACGAAFAEMASRYPQSSQRDTYLWNAGHCYEAAGMLGPAVHMRKRILSKFPHSRHAPLAAYFVAGNYHNLAFFKDAARWYERFTDRWGTHRSAPEALMWAIVLRGGLGHEREMMKNAATFIRKYKGRKKQLSARAFWLVIKMYESLGNTDRVLVNLHRYVREYGATGDADKAIEAYARLGALYWRASCKVPMIHGQCIRVRYYRREGRKKKQKRIVYLPRDRRDLAASRRFFAQAWALWNGGRVLKRIPASAADRADQVRNARHWAAYARFMQAEVKFEPYLKLRIPRRLRFDPRRPRLFQRAEKRFGKWVLTKLKTAQRLNRDFLGVVTQVRVQESGTLRGDPHWSIAAVARSGMIYHNFADLLLALKPPKYLRTAEAKDAFIGFIEKIATKLLDRAQAGYRACLKVSGKLRWFNEWSRVCEREINRLEPDRYPLANERRAGPGYVAVRVDAAGFKFGKGGER